MIYISIEGFYLLSYRRTPTWFLNDIMNGDKIIIHLFIPFFTLHTFVITKLNTATFLA